MAPGSLRPSRFHPHLGPLPQGRGGYDIVSVRLRIWQPRRFSVGLAHHGRPVRAAYGRIGTIANLTRRATEFAGAVFDRYTAALAYQDYRTLWIANLCSGAAAWALIVARGALVYNEIETNANLWGGASSRSRR